MQILTETLKESIFITGFIFSMMVIIEYINLLSKGIILEKLQIKYSQYIIASFLGIIPGCLGSFIAVALYSHRKISIGALISCMIATSGDEAFLMLAMFPQKALILFVLLFFIGIASGFLVDKLFNKQKLYTNKEKCIGLNIHSDRIEKISLKEMVLNLKKNNFLKLLLIICIIIYIICVQFAIITEHDFNKILKIMVLFSMGITFLLVIGSDKHLIEEHIYKHILKNHIINIFLWTFGILLFIGFLLDNFNIETYIQNYSKALFIIAALIGLLPLSGPNMIFVTLYAKSVIPFNILLVNSIIQDGHGTLPLISLSRKDFFIVKIINFIIGIIIGLLILVFMQ